MAIALASTGFERRIRSTTTALAIGIALSACGGAQPGATTPTTAGHDSLPATTSTTTADTTSTADTTDVGPTSTLDETMTAAVSQASNQLAGDLEIDASGIEVVSAEQVTWPDGSLGCPQPGVMYTQATVEGVRIILDVDGAEYAFHGAEGNAPVRCEDPQMPVSSG